jgi:DNA-binding GntR family transcriptional regulator
VRRTTADELFDQLRADIEKSRLLPGTMLSEADVQVSHRTRAEDQR